MKRFQFRLERVVRWREEQLAVEEAGLHLLQAESASLAARRSDLEAEQAAAAQALVRAATIDAEDLYREDGSRRYTARELERIAAQKTAAERKIVEQRKRVLEARKNLELLNRLRAKRRSTWLAEFDRELEQQASEAHLIRTHAVSASE